MKKYQLKTPINYYAIQWTGENFNEIKDICGDSGSVKEEFGKLCFCHDDGSFKVPKDYYIIFEDWCKTGHTAVNYVKDLNDYVGVN